MELQADKTAGFKAISEDDLVIFDHDRGIEVNKVIHDLVKGVDKALVLMNGGWSRRPASFDQPEMNTKTYQRLVEIQDALVELETVTKPVVKTRF